MHQWPQRALCHGHYGRCSGLLCIQDCKADIFIIYPTKVVYLTKTLMQYWCMSSYLSSSTKSLIGLTEMTGLMSVQACHPRVPESVNKLCEALCNNLYLKLYSKFRLWKTTDIKDLPTDQATLKVLFTFSDPVSDSTLVTASLSSPNGTSSVEWPAPFLVPDFSNYVELQLSAAKDACARDGIVMVVHKCVKSEILDKLS